MIKIIPRTNFSPQISVAAIRDCGLVIAAGRQDLFDICKCGFNNNLHPATGRVKTRAVPGSGTGGDRRGQGVDPGLTQGALGRGQGVDPGLSQGVGGRGQVVDPGLTQGAGGRGQGVDPGLSQGARGRGQGVDPGLTQGAEDRGQGVSHGKGNIRGRGL